MLFEPWKAWYFAYFLGEPVAETTQCLSGESFPQYPIWCFADAISLNFFVSYHRSSERGGCDFPYHLSPWGSFTGHPSNFSSPRWTKPDALCKSCPWDLPPSWSPSSGSTPIVWYSSYIEVSKTTHSTCDEAAPVQCRMRQSTQSASYLVIEVPQDMADPFCWQVQC